MRKDLGLALRTRVLLAIGFFVLLTLLTQFDSISGAATNDKGDVKKPVSIDFTLQEEDRPNKLKPNIAQAKTENLLEDRLKQLLSLLSPLEAAKEKPFVLPEQSLVKPDLPGKRILEKFPPDSKDLKKPQVEIKKEDLKVVRVSHTGPVDTVGQFTVTFSQPMVPVAEAKLESNPEKYVQMTPRAKGTWRWLGTETLLFEPEGKRFPRATIFKCCVPEGTKSINGGILKKVKNWTVTTSEPGVKTFFPVEGDPQNSAPLIVAIFNQRIDRKSALNHLSVKAGGTVFPVKVVDKSIVAHDYGLEKFSDDEWLAVRPANALPLASKVTVTFKKGYKSIEGPLTAASDQVFDFSVYGPLKFMQGPQFGVSPDDWNSRNFTFNNRLDSTSVKPSTITIEPAVAGAQFQASGERVYLTKALLPNTRYRVTFNRDLKDNFGQSLAKRQTVSFTTGPYRTRLNFERLFITIPASRKPGVLIKVQGAETMDVVIYRVDSEDYRHFAGKHHGRSKSWLSSLDDKVVAKKTIELKPQDKEISLDLTPYMKGKFGQFVVSAHVYDEVHKRDYYQACWLQVTDLSIDAFKGDDLVALVTSLEKGTPVVGANVVLEPSHNSEVTGRDGLALLPLSARWEDSTILIVARGKDCATLPANSWYRGGWYKSKPGKVYKWYGITDRNLYKPGETVNVKGWSRELSYTDKEKIILAEPPYQSLLYRVTGSDGKEISTGTVKVDDNGGFDFDFEIPEKVNLGRGQISFGLKEKNQDYLEKRESAIRKVSGFKSLYSLSFDIQEFRRPEFEMSVTSSKGTSMIFGEQTNITAKAKYFAGGSLVGSPINWRVNANLSSYAPPGWQEFRFGHDQPYWSRSSIWPSTINNKSKTVQTSADINGESTVKVKLDVLPVPRPVSCVCEATIQDVNRQSWSDKVTVLVHPSDIYLGIKQSKWFYRVEDPIELDLVAVDIDGKVQEGRPIRVELQRIEETKDHKQNIVSVETTEVVSGSLPVRCNFKVEKGGSYQTIATVADSQGRKNETLVSTWITDEKATVTKTIQSDKLLVIADKEKYQPGDEVELMVSSPFYPAHGIITVRRSSIVETIPIEIESPSATFKIPVKEDYYPNFALEVYLAGENYRFGSETVHLKVPPATRRLALSARARDSVVMPGSDTTIDIELKDADGRPIKNGQVALAVADESVLALSGYKWSDPIETFYPESSPHVQNTFSRDTVLLTPKKESEKGSLGGAPADPRYGQSNEVGRVGGPRDMNLFQVEPTAIDERHYTSGRAKRHEKQQVRVRTDFNALALFKPAIYTDENGKANVVLHLPDSLTRYRVMAVAVAGKNQFGSSESNLTAKMPLMVKPSAPRFLNFGDKCELPVVLQNQTDRDIAADVILRGVNVGISDHWQNRPQAKTQPGQSQAESGVLQSSAGKHLIVPANNRVEVRFPVSATDEGIAKFQCAVVADKFTDASQFSLPVFVPAVLESFAAYGQLDKGAIAQKLSKPTNVFHQVGGLSISSSSTAVQALTDAYFQLRDYQFGCSEQLSSRVIAMVSLHDVLVAFGKMDALALSKYRAKIQQDLDQLLTRQNSDGSFGLWTRDEGRGNRYPYMSIQVARALVLALENDFKVDVTKLERALGYLKNIRKYIPAEYPERLKRSIEARALNIRYLAGNRDSAAAADLIKRALADRISKMPKGADKSLSKIPVDFVKADLSLDSAGWLLPIICKDEKRTVEKDVLRELITSSINETPSTASSNDRGYGDFDYCYFYSPRRTDAIVMEALMETEPDNPLIPKLAKGLLAHRKNGTWSGTQENGYILQSLCKYFNKYEKVTPDFSVGTWLGDTLVASSQFRGRGTETKVTTVPMSNLLGISGDTILIDKNGPGRLYYRIGIDYAPCSLNLKPVDFGFAVSRTYEAVDNKDDVRKDGDGVWHFKSGALVKTKLSFTSAGSRYHLALSDPLPAGAEPVNTALAGNRQLSTSARPGRRPVPYDHFYPWWRMSWFEHQNLRDHQAEAFASVLYSGKYQYEYQIRATTPGHYHVPPTKVEEMYSPETFGRSGTEEVIVE